MIVSFNIEIYLLFRFKNKDKISTFQINDEQTNDELLENFLLIQLTIIFFWNPYNLIFSNRIINSFSDLFINFFSIYINVCVSIV